MKKNKNTENYLERIPVRRASIGFSKNDAGIVTLKIENKGAFNFIAQKLFKKPRISYIHLDEQGSFVWLNIDGKSDIVAVGEKVKARFGEKSEPLYERLAKFFQILESYGFVNFIKPI